MTITMGHRELGLDPGLSNSASTQGFPAFARAIASVLAGPPARIEHGAGEPAAGRQPYDRGLRPADVPSAGP
jgi:hypothetical protein